MLIDATGMSREGQLSKDPRVRRPAGRWARCAMPISPDAGVSVWHGIVTDPRHYSPLFIPDCRATCDVE